MKYFFDTEFFEGFHKPLFGKNRHFIDLISIGMVAEDGREYYAISNEFDLKVIWHNKDPWVKDNVLKKIHAELCQKQSTYTKTHFYGLFAPFTLAGMQNLIKWHGKSNKQIANDIRHFVYSPALKDFPSVSVFYGLDGSVDCWLEENSIEFYGYYADYDWVLFCSLFGRMMDLPKGFPMYCKDLKQMMDERGFGKSWKDRYCPEMDGEHSAIVDAYWNLSLFEALKTHAV